MGKGSRPESGVEERAHHLETVIKPQCMLGARQLLLQPGMHDDQSFIAYRRRLPFYRCSVDIFAAHCCNAQSHSSQQAVLLTAGGEWPEQRRAQAHPGNQGSTDPTQRIRVQYCQTEDTGFGGTHPVNADLWSAAGTNACALKSPPAWP